MSSCRLGVVGLLLGLVLAACGDGDGSAPEPELWTVPAPPLDQLEDAVRDRLRESQAELDAAVDRGADDLGERMGETGKLYHAHGFVDAAEACYLNARRLDPETFDWPYLLGRLYGQNGDGARGEEALARALELREDYVPAWIALGHLRRETNRLPEAAEAYDQALRLDADSPAAWIGLGRTALAREDYAAAVEHLERARKQAAYATEIFYPLGMAYRGLGRLDEAKAALARRGTVVARIEDPLMDELRSLEEGMRLHLNRGTTAFAQGQFTEAERSFRAAVEADPASPLARTNLAAALTRLGRLDEAFEHTERALELDADDGRSNFSMATLLARRGDDPAALEHYEKAVEADPSYKDAHFNYANALRRLGRFDAAARHFETVVRLEPHHATARFGQILSLAQNDRWREAVERAEEGYELLDGHPALAEALVRLLSAAPVEELRDGARALPVAESLMAKEKTLSRVESLAMALAEVGRVSEAVQWQTAALEAARAGGVPPSTVSRIADHLALYEAGRPCRDPWPWSMGE